MSNWLSWAAFDGRGVTELAKVSLLTFFHLSLSFGEARYTMVSEDLSHPEYGS